MSLQATVSPRLPASAASGFLAVSGLACVRGERMVFTDLSFTLAAGHALIVRGPNGAGKSSLLRMLAGLLRPAAGTVGLNGTAMADDGIAWRRNLAWLGHLDALRTTETPRETLRFIARLHGRTDFQTALTALDLDSLADTPIRFLSAGQKRRVALAGLVASNVPLWLADEPTTALDADHAALFQAVLGRHLAAGGLAVLSTHETFPPSAECHELELAAA